ncbi:hypothetical protein [Fluviispira sanaruensis]|uniref:Uncharacterized protein n=1 Tax=Fluviispira sanaruensis TaxID=2493639 RepID=A0A4P2VIZ7_FLUSA|nr:hypothetical protein [Fluviispira sanaruensis]BBH51864.1 hypothetical protein JCM31447_02880 [Fluviispira sanaruensis]
MNLRESIYLLKKEFVNDNINDIIFRNKAFDYFCYIDPNIVNVKTGVHINLGIDILGLSEHYIEKNYVKQDPFLHQFKNLRMQTYHYKELELSQIKMPGSSERAGVILNRVRSSLFNVNSGMYRTIQLTNTYSFICLYGREKKDFLFEVDLNFSSRQGRWFWKFEQEMIECMKKYLHEFKLPSMRRG